MPKKSVKRSSLRKAKSAAKLVLDLNQGFLIKEQDAFHKAHPQARLLISIFLICYLVFVAMYLYKNPSIFSMFVQ